MARQKFNLTFAQIINVPVRVKKISKEIALSFKEYHAKEGCGYRLGRKTWCNHCGVEVPATEKGKGWVTTDKQEQPYQFSAEELSKLVPKDIVDATIEVINIVEPLDGRWYNGNHKVVDVQDANPNYMLSYSLFLRGLEKSGRVALVRYFDSNKVYVATLNHHGILSGVFWGDEVDEKATIEAREVDSKLLNMMNTLIKSWTKPFNPVTDLVDTYRDQVTKAAMEKIEKGAFTVETPATETKKEDLTGNFADAMAKAFASLGISEEAPAETASQEAPKTRKKKSA